jgi:hypothetical protein
MLNLSIGDVNIHQAIYNLLADYRSQNVQKKIMKNLFDNSNFKIEPPFIEKHKRNMRRNERVHHQYPQAERAAAFEQESQAEARTSQELHGQWLQRVHRNKCHSDFCPSQLGHRC